MTHKVTKPIALDESFRTTEQNPQNIADVLANKLDAIKSAIENGGSDEMEAAFECHYNVTSATDIYNAMQDKKVPFFYQNGVVAQLWKVETNKYTFRTTSTRVVEGENILDIVDYIVNGSVWSTATKTISGGSSSQQAYLAKVESSVNFDTTGLSGMQSIISVNDVPADGVYQLSIFMCITPKTASATKSDLVFQFTGTSGTGMPNTTFHAVVDDSQTFGQQLSFSTTLNLKAGTNSLKMACGGLNTEYLVFVDDLTVAQLVNGVYHNGDDFDDVHTLTQASDFNNDDGVLVDGTTGGPRFMLWQTLANKVLGFIKSLSTTITAFRTGDVIPVDGPSGTAKMAKDDLLKNTAQNALAGNLAPNFSISTSYVSGDAVIYEGKLYVFTSDHPAGAWIGTDAQHINETYITSRLASRTSIANTFSDSTAYSAGDFVTHKGQFYRFKVDHAAGAFDASEMQYQNVPLFADYYSKNTDLKVKYGMLFNFEEGDCNISNSGWSPFDNDKHRVRIKKGMYPYLKAGYKITLSSFVGKENKPLRFFLGVQKNDGTYYTPGSWYTSEYTCEYNGFYTILLAYVGDLLPTRPSVDDLSEKLVIKDSNGVILTPNYRIEVNTKKFDEETTYSNMLFEVGNIDYATWIYQTSTKRIRLKKESILHLCPGDKIYLTDYTDAAFYVGWHDMSGTADKQGWNTSEFVVTDEGYYSIIVKRKDGLDIVNKDWLLSLVRVEHNGILYQGKDAVQRQLDIVGVNAWQDSPFADIRSMAHRGLSDDFPENTLISFRAARKAGFTYVETDIRRTSDGHWVCIHDYTVDRTSDGTGNVEDMTLAQLKALDFGSWKDAKFAGEKIPTLEEFMSCCKALNLRPYLELKGGVSSRALMEDIVGIIRSYGMDDKVTIIGFASYGQWLYRDHVWDEARLGAIVNSVDTTDPYYSIMVGWRADGHDVFYDSAATPDATTLTQLKSDKLPLERWSVYSASDVININSYVSGITSNFLIASKILYENDINKSSLR